MINVHLQLFGLDLDETVRLARRMDELGFRGVWFSDHLVTPLHYESRYPYDPSGVPGYQPDTVFPDVWTLMACIAGQTEHLQMGTGVFILPLRNAFMTARAVGTLQLLSHGRVLFGIGAGWMAEEFEAVGVPFAQRGVRLEETVQVMRELWTGNPVSYEGKLISFPAVQMAPAVTPGVPIVVGGHSDPALDRAARIGDGWYAMPSSRAEAERHRDAIESRRARHRRSSTPFTYFVRPSEPLSANVLSEYEQAGFTDVVLSFRRLVAALPESPQARFSALEDIATEWGVGPL
jgi:probable F420-dependent oxidoreductase